MNKKKRFIIVLIIGIISSILIINYNKERSFDNLLNTALAFINKKASDLKKISGTGSLVDSKENLEDSKITGEEYVNDNNFYPYYTMISSKERKIYQQIYQNIIEYKTTFVPIVSINKEELEKSITAVYNDHPEIFWTDLNYSYKYIKNGEVVQVILKFNSTFKEIENSRSIFEQEANRIISEAEIISSDYEKEKYVHDSLLKMIDYRKNSYLNQSAYSALVNHKTVCAGYSKAFQYIMINLGIPTYYVSGTAGEDHSWNIVKLSDGYYNVDLTWDDTSNISYNYFNMPDDIFSTTHTRTELSVNLPACNAYQFKGIKTYEKKKRPSIENNIIPKDNKSVIINQENNSTIQLEQTEKDESSYDNIMKKEDIIEDSSHETTEEIIEKDEDESTLIITYDNEKSEETEDKIIPVN